MRVATSFSQTIDLPALFEGIHQGYTHTTWQCSGCNYWDNPPVYYQDDSAPYENRDWLFNEDICNVEGCGSTYWDFYLLYGSCGR